METRPDMPARYEHRAQRQRPVRDKLPPRLSLEGLAAGPKQAAHSWVLDAVLLPTSRCAFSMHPNQKEILSGE